MSVLAIALRWRDRLLPCVNRRDKLISMRRHETIGRIPHGDDPLAYLLTWTTYGTWLPGDDRGWVEKRADFREADIERQRQAVMRMTEDAIVLTSEQRELVESVIRKHCEIRRWHLHAVNCRTNHVHAVITADRHPDDIMDQLKAWCTRRLKEHQKTESPSERARQNWWTQRGSKQPINDLDGLARAVEYVVDGQ